MILAVYNIKGGVGKTSSAVNLAYLAWKAGRRTLLWDLDPQGSASFYFRIKPRIKGGAKKLVTQKKRILSSVRESDFRGLDVVPADFSYRFFDLHLNGARKPKERLSSILLPLVDEYPTLIVDCAPSISLVSESLFAAADALLVPTIPTPLSLQSLARLEKHLRRNFPDGPKLLPFFSMVDRRKKLHRAICRQRGGGGVRSRFLETAIPYSSLVEQMGLARAPLGSFAPGCSAAQAYQSLWDEIGGLLTPPSGARFQAPS